MISRGAGLEIWHLSDGRGTYFICMPLSDTDGLVTGGSWYCQEVVRLPHLETWSTGARVGAGGRCPPATPVSPFDVEIVFDVLTGHCVDPNYADLAAVDANEFLDRMYRAWLAGVAARTRWRAVA